MTIPGDSDTPDWLQRAEAIRLKPLILRSQAEKEELERAETRARATLPTPPEVADDPATLFVDEARRPLINGGDSLSVYQQQCCAEAATFAQALVSRVGEAVARVALQAALDAIKH